MDKSDLIIIGSPRGHGSNSSYIAQLFIKGYNKINTWNPNVIFLAELQSIIEHIQQFQKANRIIWFLPLYTDAMPALMKNFMDKLSPTDFQNKKIGFFIISGFYEIEHSIYLERYFTKLIAKYDAHLLGTVIKGGMEDLIAQPKWTTLKTQKCIKRLGIQFAINEIFDQKIAKRIRYSERPSFLIRTSIYILDKLRLMDNRWKHATSGFTTQT